MSLGAVTRSPLFWILLVAAGLRLTGLFWGLPGSDGWDNDGFAPRNFLTALALTWKPGSYFTYPPLHALLLAVPSLPVAAWALAHAPSLSQHDVIAAITQPQYATYFAVVARLVSLAMSLGIIWSVGEMARLVAGPRAGLFAAGACALNMALTYYGQISNLDVPYLFWAMLSLLAVMRAIALHQPRRFWHAALLAAAAVATKDQAYALFLATLPAGFGLWFAVDSWPRRNARLVWRPLLLAALVAILALLLVDGAITNPSGFLRRLAFLAGPASGDYAQYSHGFFGWLALSGDIGAYYIRGYGVVAVAVAGLGLLVHLRVRGDRARWVAGLLPLLGMISFTLCFNFVALRSDDRFLLPQGVLACVYIGLAAEAIGHARLWLRLGAQAVLAMVALLAIHQSIAVDAAMLLDPRYDAQAWLAARSRPGDGIEVYDRNWMLPRFPQTASVTRLGQGDLKLRNPLPGVTELRQAFLSRRAPPRFILVSGVWARRFLRDEPPLTPGHIYSRLQQEDFRNADGRHYFQALVQGRLPYQLMHVSRYQGRFWPAVHIHDSLNEPIAIYERLR